LDKGGAGLEDVGGDEVLEDEVFAVGVAAPLLFLDILVRVHSLIDLVLDWT
jgi:hypothetical protein